MHEYTKNISTYKRLILSCKKEANIDVAPVNKFETTDQSKLFANGTDNWVSKSFSTSSTTGSQTQTVVINPNSTSSPANAKVGTNKVQPGYSPIIATVVLAGGFASVTLSSYSQTLNGVTLTCTVFGVVANGNEVAFFVHYQQSSGGVSLSSVDTEYFAHF